MITSGGIQSNHARTTAVAARQLGLQPHLVLRWSGEIVSTSYNHHTSVLSLIEKRGIHWKQRAKHVTFVSNAQFRAHYLDFLETIIPRLTPKQRSRLIFGYFCCTFVVHVTDTW